MRQLRYELTFTRARLALHTQYRMVIAYIVWMRYEHLGHPFGVYQTMKLVHGVEE